MQVIDDPDDPRLDDYRHLADAAARRALEPDRAPNGIFVAEGLPALNQLLASSHRLRSVLVTPARATSLAERLAGIGPVMVAERPVLAAVTGFDVHRGVLAAADRPGPTDAADLLRSSRRVLVLEAVNDNENVGALFRNAAAMGLDAVILDGACTDPLYRRSIRVSSGWTLQVPFARTDSTATTLRLAAEHGIRTVALSPSTDGIDVDRAASEGLLDEPFALVAGAEGPGLTGASIAACDLSVRVPMATGVDSLNVATAMAVVSAFSAARRGWA